MFTHLLLEMLVWHECYSATLSPSLNVIKILLYVSVNFFSEKLQMELNFSVNMLIMIFC